MACYFIDTTDALMFMLNEIQDTPDKPPSFYIDAEGHKLGRFGTLDLLQIHVLPLQETFIIDIFTLKIAAFNTRFAGTSLRTLLESSSTAKVLFDVRNDSDALFSHYNISLEGAVDLQLMEYYQPGRTGRRLSGLQHCIEHDSGICPEHIQHWKEVKNSQVRLIQNTAAQEPPPSRIRPLSADLLLYAAGDVELLPSLYQKYHQRLTKQGLKDVKAGTGKRLSQSRQPTYNPHGKDKGKGPYRVPQSTLPNTRRGTKPQLERSSNSHEKAKASVTGASQSTSPGPENVKLRNFPVAFVKEGQSPQPQGKKKQKATVKSRRAKVPEDDDLDWTLCDKDCGWCGHCFDPYQRSYDILLEMAAYD